MLWSLFLIRHHRTFFYAAVQVKGRGGSGGCSSTKAYFHLFYVVLFCFTGLGIDCVIQHPSLSHVYSFNGV